VAQSKYPESGLSAVLDLTNWSGPVKSYLADVDKLNKADTTSEKSAGKSSAAKDRYARTLKFASDVAKAATAQFQSAGATSAPGTRPNARPAGFPASRNGSSRSTRVSAFSTPPPTWSAVSPTGWPTWPGARCGSRASGERSTLSSPR
jgi:hypothetical protein